MVVQATLILFGVFFVMLFSGVPISVGIGIASIVTALFSFDPSVFAITAAQRCFSGIDSFSLLALPFFTLAGNIMNKGGIAQRLVRLARLAVGWIPGYLAATNVLANMFFGAISGSSVAATSAMGSIMNPWKRMKGMIRTTRRQLISVLLRPASSSRPAARLSCIPSPQAAFPWRRCSWADISRAHCLASAFWLLQCSLPIKRVTRLLL